MAPMLSGLCALAAIFASANAVPSAVATEVTATNFVQKTIYHSPETPGYSSWCTLWRTKNGQLRVTFQQVTGPVAAPQQRTNVTVIIGSSDEGKTWNKLREIPARKHLVTSTNSIYAAPDDTSFCGHGLAALPDGTLVTGLWGRTGEDFGYVQRSSDDGRTWSKAIFFADKRYYRTWPSAIHRLRNGHLILFAGIMKRKPGELPTTRILKAMFESKDKGKTWSEPIWLMPESTGVCEESDFTELDNGDLLFVHRVEHYERGGQYVDGEKYVSDRWQGLVRRHGKKWEVEAPTKAPFPHGGFPELLKTREGVVLYVAVEGIWWTTDAGTHWQRLDLKGDRSYMNAVPSPAFPPYPGIVLGGPYYPRAMQLTDGTILVVGHNGSDNAYGSVDQAIVQQTFKLTVNTSK